MTLQVQKEAITEQLRQARRGGGALSAYRAAMSVK